MIRCKDFLRGLELGIYHCLGIFLMMVLIAAVTHYAEAADEVIPNDQLTPPTDQADWIYCTVTVGDLSKMFVGARLGADLYVLDNDEGIWKRKSWEKAHHFVGHHCPKALPTLEGMIARGKGDSAQAASSLRKSRTCGDGPRSVKVRGKVVDRCDLLENRPQCFRSAVSECKRGNKTLCKEVDDACARKPGMEGCEAAPPPPPPERKWWWFVQVTTDGRIKRVRRNPEVQCAPLVPASTLRQAFTIYNNGDVETKVFRGTTCR